MEPRGYLGTGTKGCPVGVKMLRTRRVQFSEEMKFESPFFPPCNQGEASWAETWEEIEKGTHRVVNPPPHRAEGQSPALSTTREVGGGRYW